MIKSGKFSPLWTFDFPDGIWHGLNLFSGICQGKIQKPL